MADQPQFDLPHNDQPILTPDQDRFGVDPFAHTLARSLLQLSAPRGTVVALNGPWGSGKSSALNLIRHHLADAVKADELSIVDFNCWWFRGEDALALAFFRELNTGLAPSLSEKTKKLLPKVGARLLRAGSAIGGAVDMVAPSGIGTMVSGSLDFLSGLIEQDESVEKLHAELAAALAAQKKKFLVVIDDIDRLSPDEALLIFRLVKSVGVLPNVMYLLVFDRELAERIVGERYPSEGPHYLEKIVQAGFELPEPLDSDVQDLLLSRIAEICGTPDETLLVRFMNLFHDIVAHEVRSPRDVARFTNSLAVTWPAVAPNVDTADFVALEALRLMRPRLYRAIRQNKNAVCNGPREDIPATDRSSEWDQRLLASFQPEVRNHYRRALMRLFPVLEAVWSNVRYGGDGTRWARERRVCSALHFDTYFRFGVGTEVLTRGDLDDLIGKLGDAAFVEETFRKAVGISRAGRGTLAQVLLSELRIHADRVNRADLPALLDGLFRVADDLDVEADKQGMMAANNSLRLHWLIRALTEGTRLPERSALYVAACEHAALGWLADFSASAWTDYHPHEGHDVEAEERCLTTEADAQIVRDLLHRRVAQAAADGSLVQANDLAHLLYRWADADEGAAVHEWTHILMKEDAGIEILAQVFTSSTWSHSLGFGGMGDTVARRTARAQVDSLDKVLDVGTFRARVEEIAARPNASPVVADFLHAWRMREQRASN